MSIYQIKITLKDTKPPIWRRILVDSNTTFRDLATIIITTLGWSGYHSYSFNFWNKKDVSGEIKKILRKKLESEGFNKKELSFMVDHRCEHLNLGRDGFCDLPDKEIKINQIIKPKQRCSFDYNSMNAVEFEVLVEKELSNNNKKLPICTGGKRFMPFEDINGVWEYYDCLEILKKPKKNRRIPEEYEEIVETLECFANDEGVFDPEVINIEDINECLSQEILEETKSAQETYYSSVSENEIEDGESFLNIANIIQQAVSFDKHGKPYLDNKKLDEALSLSEDDNLEKINEITKTEFFKKVSKKDFEDSVDCFECPVCKSKEYTSEKYLKPNQDTISFSCLCKKCGMPVEINFEI